MDTCEICCSKPSRITCTFCDFKSCKKCAEKFLTTNTTLRPHCMKCKTIWTKRFLSTMFSKLFIDQRLKFHQEVVTIDGEKAKLPFYHALADIEHSHRMYKNEIENMRSDILQKTRDLIALRESLQQLITRNFVEDTNSHKIIKCPQTGCRGYLNLNWFCTLCSFQACSVCFKRSETGHTCDPTIRFDVQRVTRPCPSCNERICKVDDCDQMWCMLCLKPFSWKSGQVIGSEINLNNPHLLQYMKTNQIQDLCTYIIQFEDLISRAQKINIAMDHHFEKFFWITEQLRYHLNCLEVDPNNEFKLVGISFVLGEIDEPAWKKKVLSIEKKANKFNHIQNVIQVYVHVSTDIFFNLNTFFQSHLDQRSILMKMHDAKIDLFNLKSYFNEQMNDIGTQYTKSVVPLINDHIDLIDSNVFQK